MKSAQWLAILVLASMVGGISFISVYLGGRSETDVPLPTTTTPSLSFPFKVFPQPGDNVMTTEVGHRGYQDYWFYNDCGQDLTVGLSKKGCTCSEVEIAVAPPTWWMRLFYDAATQSFHVPPCGLTALTTLAALRDPARLQQVFPDDGATPVVLTKENSTMVPAGAIGRARLSWRQTEVKPLITFADLWMGQRDGGTYAHLEAGVRIAAPLDVANKELALPTISDRDLENKKDGQRSWIVCWSLTRPTFDLKAEMIHERLSAESDPIQLGDPVPLTAADFARLERHESLKLATILSGYRIPVTMRAKAKDGTPIQWGHFRRLVQLNSSDPTIDPVQVTVTGAVTGDVDVGSGPESGSINLGPFYRKRGTHGEIILQTDEQSVDLKLDESHLPEYLKPSLGQAQKTASGHRLWKLKVEVPAGAASGDFPRADNPVYRDSAIYVKTVDAKSGKSLRSIRIPVRGVANEG